MLHSHAHNFKSVHNKLHLPFHKNISIQKEVEVEGFRIMSDATIFSAQVRDSRK